MDIRLKKDNSTMNTVRKIYIRITNLGNSRKPIRYKKHGKGSADDTSTNTGWNYSWTAKMFDRIDNSSPRVN